MKKEYLGDSVYCEIMDVGGVKLTTENGLRTDPSNTIYFEYEVISAFLDYLERHGFLRKPKRG